MKRHLIEQLKADHGMSDGEAANIVDWLFPSLAAALEAKDIVTIPGFGTFRRKYRKARDVRNPRTGDWHPRDAHFVVTFKAARQK